MSGSYILDAARTPRGRGKAGKGALSSMHPQELFAQVLRGLAARGSFEPVAVDDVVAGVVSQVNEQGANLARNAVLAAGWPIEVSATTVNRFCGSGLQAVSFTRKLDLDPERWNVNGGAIALGHPLGATGAILLGTALDELERTNKATALITLCIGGGQGIATIIERLS
jgi:acetyl-CoA acetyltransferase